MIDLLTVGNITVGGKVWTCAKGWATVEYIYSDDISGNNHAFKAGGRLYTKFGIRGNDKFPTAFLTDPYGGKY